MQTVSVKPADAVNKWVVIDAEGVVVGRLASYIALRLRDDTASEPDRSEANQRSAPAVERGLFLVPKVIE